jgi:hypothetical protein
VGVADSLRATLGVEPVQAHVGSQVQRAVGPVDTETVHVHDGVVPGDGRLVVVRAAGNGDQSDGRDGRDRESSTPGATRLEDRLLSAAPSQDYTTERSS